MRAKSLFVATFVASFLVSSFAAAAESTYDFTDPKRVNSVIFVLDSEIEAIMGVANDISGKVTFDPKKPKALKGKIVVQSKSIHIQNGTMKNKAHSPQWLGVAKFPEITFEVKKVKSAKKDKKKKGTHILALIGDFTIKGITKKVTVNATVTHLPNMLKDRFPRREGDLMVLRASFTLKRSDFKIGDNRMPSVADDMEIRIAICGGTEKKDAAS